MQTQNVPLDQIDIYGGTQTRVLTNEEVLENYAEAMSAGVEFPPIAVYFDGAAYWLADGFHRYLAAKRIGAPTIRAEVKPGGRIDALRHALGANATHGVYRTNADKRNAVGIALEEWPDRANSVIAEICRVSVSLVRTCRQELTESGKIEHTETVIGRDGKEYPSQMEPAQMMEHEPRGKTEESSSKGEGGGGGGKPSSKGEGGAPGGTNAELEREARAMMRRGEMNPFELKTLMTANAHDYAATVINLLGTMKPDAPKRQEGLVRIKRWVERALAGEVMTEPEFGQESE